MARRDITEPMTDNPSPSARESEKEAEEAAFADMESELGRQSRAEAEWEASPAGKKSLKATGRRFRLSTTRRASGRGPAR